MTSPAIFCAWHGSLLSSGVHPWVIYPDLRRRVPINSEPDFWNKGCQVKSTIGVGRPSILKATVEREVPFQMVLDWT
jgi:hypothetical protein